MDEMSADEFRARYGNQRGNKYRAEPTVVDGVKLASKAEARRFRQLQMMERVGAIQDLEVHPRFDLIVAGVKVGVYTADFRYTDCESKKLVVEDVKGGRATITEAYRLRKRIVKALYDVEVTEVEA